MKKINILRLLLIISFIVFIYYYFRPKKYETNYIVDNYNIKEIYDDAYYFDISDENYSFKYYYPIKYQTKRKLINKVHTFKNNNHYCIYFDIEKYDDFPMCYRNKELIDYRLIDDPKFKEYLDGKVNINYNYINTKFDNINLYYGYKSIIAIWNYKEVLYIKNDIIKRINILKRDVVDNSLMAIANKYLFIPNYDQNNNFDEAYIINLESGVKKLWKMTNSINYESYVLGDLDNKIYVVDKKERLEYELDLEKELIKIISTEDGLAKIYDNGWKEIALNKLLVNNYSFNKQKNNYSIEENKLYVINPYTKNKMRISNIEDPIIIFEQNDDIFYLNDDNLYIYNNQLGEVNIINYYDWKFNKNNKIFIYNP